MGNARGRHLVLGGLAVAGIAAIIWGGLEMVVARSGAHVGVDGIAPGGTLRYLTAFGVTTAALVSVSAVPLARLGRLDRFTLFWLTVAWTGVAAAAWLWVIPGVL